jgi:hypothetical protein
VPHTGSMTVFIISWLGVSIFAMTNPFPSPEEPVPGFDPCHWLYWVSSVDFLKFRARA